jgi:hypothetical protein
MVTKSDRVEDDARQGEFGSWHEWVRQGLLFTEAVRGGPLVWPAGGNHLHGDPLGPIRHAHDEAAEYYFILSGACRVEVGGEERVVSAGDLVYIPANAPHNLLGEVGDTDMWAFILVAPNLAHNKWRLGDFLPGSEDLRMTVSRPLDGDDRARSHPFPAETLRIAAGEPHLRRSEDGELVGLITNGTAHVRTGHMAGNLGPGSYFHLRRDLDLAVAALTTATSLLLFECRFANFEGAPLADGNTV